MLQNIIFIALAVLVGLSWPLGIEPAFYDAELVCLGLVAFVALSALSGALAVALARGTEITTRRFVIRFQSTTVSRVLTLVWYFFLIYALNWPILVQETLGLGGVIFAEKALILLPVVPALAASMAATFIMDRKNAPPGARLWGQLAFQGRILLGFALLPILLILCVLDLLESVTVVQELLYCYESLYLLVSAALLLAAYTVAPLLLRFAFSTGPLFEETGQAIPDRESVPPDMPGTVPDGVSADAMQPKDPLSRPAPTAVGASPPAPDGGTPGQVENDRAPSVRPHPEEIHDRLKSLSARMNMPSMRFRVWHTGAARVPNAGMVGLIGAIRYVLISDVLLQTLSPDELESVVGHELGHAKHRHLLMYFAAATIFMVLTHLCFQLLATVDASPPTQFFFSFAAVFVFWKHILGGLSKYFECQADLEGAEAVGSPIPFMSAMEKITSMARIDTRAPSWLYRSVSERMAFAWAAFNVPGEKERFIRSLRRRLVRLAFAGVLALLGLAWLAFQDYREAPGRRQQLNRSITAFENVVAGFKRYESRDFEGALPFFAGATSSVPHWAPYKILLADTLRELGRTSEAWQVWRLAVNDAPAHPLHRIWLTSLEESLKATGPRR
ncbi:MAG: M48 family metalloprotease [Planctomycetota bacterium]|nr:M48 family metalloprotease [Planctomycetota bacterium]